MNSKNWQKSFFLLVSGILLMVCAMLGLWKASAFQQQIAGKVLRFHILANSDSREDQTIKMQVKEEILKWLREEIPESETAGQYETQLLSRREEIQQKVQQSLQKYGQSGKVKTEITKDFFPQKEYGDCRLPAGTYQTLRIVLGEGEGHNWWCVLFPTLCFRDSVHGVVTEEGKEQIKKTVTEEEYERLFSVTEDSFQIKWLFFH